MAIVISVFWPSVRWSAQIDSGRRVIDRGLGQRVGHDRTRCVDAEMELFPATLAVSAVFRGGPFTLARHGESRAIYDEMDALARADSTQRKVKVLAAPRERRVVGRGGRLRIRAPTPVNVLKEHWKMASRREPGELVFSKPNGQPFRESKLLTRVLQPAAVEAGLGRLTWHQFRHIHSSLLNDLRVPMKIAQEQLGHASISTTLGIYTHVVDASHRSAVEAVEERLFVESVSNCLESGKPRNRDTRKYQRSFNLGLEAPPGFEPGMEVLQGHPRSFSRDRGFGLFRQKSEASNGLRGWLLPARCVRR